MRKKKKGEKNKEKAKKVFMSDGYGGDGCVRGEM